MQIRENNSAHLTVATGGNVGIGANNPSAQFEVAATDAGVLIPRVTLTGTTDATTISSATTSELVYNSATTSDVTPGYYYWNGASWERLLNNGDVSGDDLGDHIATENVQLTDFYLSNDGDNEGISLDDSGNATFSDNAAITEMQPFQELQKLQETRPFQELQKLQETQQLLHWVVLGMLLY